MKNDIIRIGRYRLRTIHVHYFTWFQKTYGNPYFAMMVTPGTWFWWRFRS